jgi:hypothetical protein
VVLGAVAPPAQVEGLRGRIDDLMMGRVRLQGCY